MCYDLELALTTCNFLYGHLLLSNEDMNEHSAKKLFSIYIYIFVMYVCVYSVHRDVPLNSGDSCWPLNRSTVISSKSMPLTLIATKNKNPDSNYSR
jgi:hypothetical protein